MTSLDIENRLRYLEMEVDWLKGTLPRLAESASVRGGCCREGEALCTSDDSNGFVECGVTHRTDDSCTLRDTGNWQYAGLSEGGA